MSFSNIDFSNVQFANPWDFEKQLPPPKTKQISPQSNSISTSTSLGCLRACDSTSKDISISNPQKQKPKTSDSVKTCYTIFNDYIKQIESGNISKDLNDDINKYYKGDAALALQTIKNKLDIIHKQEEYKDAFIVYADTSKNKNSFYYPNISLYNYTFLNSPDTLAFITNNISKLNFSEQNYTNFSRLYFDIDLGQITSETGKDIISVFKMIHECVDKFDLKPYGLIEYSPNFSNHLKSLESGESSVFQFTTGTVAWFFNEGMPKALSGHVYLDGYSSRLDIMNYMKYLKSKYSITTEVFDISVYKTTKQAFRMSYSPKINKDAPPRLPSQALVNYILSNPSLILQLRMAPSQTDKDISFLMSLEIPDDFLTSLSKSKSSISKSKSSISKSISIFKPSIFSYLAKGSGRGRTVKSFKSLVIEDHLSAYELSQTLLPYSNFVLSKEEIQEELEYLIPDIKTEDYSDDQNIEWFNEKLYPLFLNDYKQDLSNITPLFTLKKNVHSFIESTKKQIAEEEKSDTPDISKLDTFDAEIDYLKTILERIDQYLDIYKYVSFASHSYYDINDPQQIRAHTKDERVLYNIYKLDDGQYVEAFPRGHIYKNQRAFKDHFKYSGETLEYIERCLTVYHSVSQFNFYRSKYLYLSSDMDQQLKNVHDLLKVLEQTFVNHDDFKYFVGFLALKVRNLTTLNKGIISQPAGETSGKDALKTFITDLISSFITVKKATVEQFTNRLNGEYLKSDLVVFEEMPKDIKDVDELINKIKTYSSSKTVNAECKGVDALEIDNNFDFIINSNHNLSKLFYNKQDCEALLKRFKVLTRKSLDMTDPFIKQTLDKFGWERQSKNERSAAEYAFYIYLKESEELNEFIDFYHSNKLTLNHVEELYQQTSIDDKTTDKCSIIISPDDYVNMFKTNYVNQRKIINKTKIADRLKIDIPSYKNFSTKSIIHEIETLDIFRIRTRQNGHSGKTELICDSDDQIKAFYDHFYSYDENAPSSSLLSEEIANMEMIRM